MVKIDIEQFDPALSAAQAEMERREAARPRRLHLGMSGGGMCARRQWYNWLWVTVSHIPFKGLCAIDDGNRGEDVIAARIQGVPDLILQTSDPETGRQFEVTDAGGHVRGHFDGIVFNHPTAPKTWHVWECKVVNEKKFAAFKKFKSDLGEKAALKAWDFVYWVQAQLYMLYGGYKRHWIVVASAGCRDWDSARTELDRSEAEFLAERMRTMVENVDELPARVSDNPKAMECRWCDFKEVCHEDAPVEHNCRTCRFSKPIDGPQWLCERFEKTLTPDEQVSGCSSWTGREVLCAA